MNICLPAKLFIIVLNFLFSLLANAQNNAPKGCISNELTKVVINKNKICYSFGKVKETEFKEKNIDENSNRI